MVELEVVDTLEAWKEVVEEKVVKTVEVERQGFGGRYHVEPNGPLYQGETLFHIPSPKSIEKGRSGSARGLQLPAQSVLIKSCKKVR